MQQIQSAAGPGSRRIVSLLDLNDTQGYLRRFPEGGRDRGRKVLAVVVKRACIRVVCKSDVISGPDFPL